MRIVVTAAGNRDRGDDGAGPAVLRRLRGKLPGGVSLLPPLTDPVRLVEAWEGADAAVVVDAMAPRGAPGRILRFDPTRGALPVDMFASSSHSLGVGHGIELARALRTLPPRIVVIGIEAADFAPRVGLTPEVDRAADRAVKAVIRQVREWHAAEAPRATTKGS
jgi:hydrogenase maturation protease